MVVAYGREIATVASVIPSISTVTTTAGTPFDPRPERFRRSSDDS